MQLIINQTFKNLLPMLSREEEKSLRESIISDGCRDPLVVWNSVIIDGHNRYQICQEEGVEFKVLEMEFSDDEAAMDWIDKNQIARRNLTPDDFRLAVGRRYNRTKKVAHGREGRTFSEDQIDPPKSTAETLATEHGISPATVKRAGKLAEAVESVEREEPEIVEQGRPAIIERAKEIVRPHVSNNSGNNEWYTPQEYIIAARIVMGKIDCDPASSETANKTVKAETFFTEEQNGLNQKWHGNIWMNPPYAQPEIRLFCEAVTDKYQSGEILQAIVLVNNATETAFFQYMMKAASCVCFPKGRIRFVDPDGNPSGAPLQGQAVVYFGEAQLLFLQAFADFGFIVKVSE